MSKENGSLIKKFYEIINRFDLILDSLGNMDNTLVRHEMALERYKQSPVDHSLNFDKIKETLSEIKNDLLKRAVHYSDPILLQTDQELTKLGILRE